MIGLNVFISGFLLFVMTSLTDAGTVPSTMRPAGNVTTMRKSVEVVVVVDKHAYRKWRGLQETSTTEDTERRTDAAITEFVNATFVSANLIWKGMEEYGLSLDLRIHTIHIIKNEDIVPSNRGVGMNEMGLAFRDWLIQNRFEFDHALLLTGLDLASRHSSSHEGYAYLNTMCGSMSVSLVENIINGIPAVVLAHEVGHTLNARHDGNQNRCNRTSGYIMNDNNIGTSPRHWNFSSCSAQAIIRKVQELDQSVDCLSEDSTWSPPVDSPYLGQIYTGDQLCQMSHGNHSYVCRHLYNRPNKRGICEVLWCLVNSTYCAGVAPIDGLPCGAGKRCLSGQCVPFDDVMENVTDTCYTGDKPGVAWGNQTCAQVVLTYTHLCNDQWYKDFCCHTCQSHYTGNDDCPYGDAHAYCTPFYCGTKWEGECCVTCRR